MASTQSTKQSARSRVPATRPSRRARQSRTPASRPSRVLLQHIAPVVDGGRYPAKATVGEPVVVEADIYVDGHDQLSCVMRYIAEGSRGWQEVPMRCSVNDRWHATFDCSHPGAYRFTIEAWVDHFSSWRHRLEQKVRANMDVHVELRAGSDLVSAAATRAKGKDVQQLTDAAALLAEGRMPAAVTRALSQTLQRLMYRYADRSDGVISPQEWPVIAERAKARYSTWYELFPRSCSATAEQHGTLRDVVKRLPYIKELGFDVLYMPPIHPIGMSHRKGKNNSQTAVADDVGSPWAIGSAEGGHMAVHPALGTVKDLQYVVQQAREQEIEIALDLAFQCSPDHPYVREHPAWFRHRADGTIQYAENPPKKYEDIYPLNFETDDWRNLWDELKAIVEFWIAQGITIFRVDNPHTKPFAFWEWLLAEIRRDHPDVLFLSEAFTRPQVMYQLAKIGFTQSYTYFTWRNGAWELKEYLTELTQPPVKNFFRPNLWPNTPDILHGYLQYGGRQAFVARLVLAATLSANYGIYGPAFELCVNTSSGPENEEYGASEKYELKSWDLTATHSVRGLITRVNAIRRTYTAMQHNNALQFHETEHEQLLCYSKQAPDRSHVIVVVVNVDPHWTHAGHVTLPLDVLGIDPVASYHVHDLLSDAHYHWQGPRNYVELNPQICPAHIFHIACPPAVSDNMTKIC